MSAAVRWFVRFGGAVAPRWLGARFARRFLTTRSPGARTLPDSARAGSVVVRGHAVPVWSMGEGPTVVLVHGWSGSAGQLRALADAFVGAGYRVVAFDAPGHGAAAGGISSVAHLVDALVAVSAAVGPIDTVVAHSMGASATALAWERLQVPPRRLVWIAPALALPRWIRGFESAMGMPRRLSDSFRDALEALAAAPLDALDAREAARALLPLALVVHDEDDRMVPAASIRALGAPDVHWTKGLGHGRILDDRDTIARIVAWADAHVQRASRFHGPANASANASR